MVKKVTEEVSKIDVSELKAKEGIDDIPIFPWGPQTEVVEKGEKIPPRPKVSEELKAKEGIDDIPIFPWGPQTEVVEKGEKIPPRPKVSEELKAKEGIDDIPIFPWGPQTEVVEKGEKIPPRPKVSEELQERMAEARETLESFEDLRLPKIGFKDGFTLTEGEEPVEEFTGIIVYTKETNVYYKGRYKAGQSEQPDCFSPDGKIPTTNPSQAPTCKVCPHNQYGSAKDGDGKACKNTRPVYFLIDGGIIPKVLRVPPTSLGMIKQYMLSVAADYGSYMGLKTKVSIYKKTEEQTHWNIKFSPAGKVSEQEKVDVKCVRDTWLNLMKEQTFVDSPEGEPVPFVDSPEGEPVPEVPQDSDNVETAF